MTGYRLKDNPLVHEKSVDLKRIVTLNSNIIFPEYLRSLDEKILNYN
jgi:hypothetical protein